METPANLRASAPVLLKVLSGEHRRWLVAVRNAVAEALARAEGLMGLRAPKSYHWADWEQRVRQEDAEDVDVG
ncbi:MAG: hypothetical protein EHM35_10830 [Planctomycetaceae bacterium]|nr:MAG: hypothetical protein EHM35_10830 [Planctomycetaceae bacterium]